MYNRAAIAYHYHGIRAQAAKVVDTHGEGTTNMKCSIEGCPGEYEDRKVLHAVRHHGRVIVIDHVPAEVCYVCADVLLKPETVCRIEALLKRVPPTAKNVPLYEYA